MMKKYADDDLKIEGDSFTEEELADLEALSEENIHLDFEDDQLDDINIDQLTNDWEAPEERSNLQQVVESHEAGSDADRDLSSDASSYASEYKSDEPKGMFNSPEVPSDQVDQPETTSFERSNEDGTISPEQAIDLPVEHADNSQTSVDADDAQQAVMPPPSFDEEISNQHVPVPRINIGIFCETEFMSGLTEKAAADRRLSKAHVSIFMGGLRKAIQYYETETTPNLLMIEIKHSGGELYSALEELASVCDPHTKVVIIGAVNDINLYRGLMDRGISEYLVAPQSPLQITSSIASLYLDPNAPPIGKSIVFVGARGGVGSSTICHNVAWSMAEHFHSDTVILDLDLAFGTASLDFEQDPSQGLAEALAAPERLDRVLLDRLLQKCTDRLSLFAAPNVLEYDYDLPASSFEEVLDMVRKGVPNMVVDLPHSWTAWTKHVLQTADEIVLTATPDLSSFRNAKNLLEAVKVTRANDTQPYLVLNQMGVPKRPEIPADQFSEALEIDPAAIINWDPNLFGMATTNAETIFETNGKSKTASSLDELTGMLLGTVERKKKKSRFDIKSLFGK